jgi:hypothetical protein
MLVCPEGHISSQKMRPCRAFYAGYLNLNASRRIVQHPEKEAYPLDAKTKFIPAEQLLAEGLG